jgi:hypothetical protein
MGTVINQAITEPYTKFTPVIDGIKTVVNPMVPSATPPDMLAILSAVASRSVTSLRRPDAVLTKYSGMSLVREGVSI